MLIYPRSYDRIFARFRPPAAIINTDRACRIFQWLICSQRPLKKFELRDAVTLHSENTINDDDTRVSERVFELCKPLVESGPNDIIRFVHVSVKELSNSSSPVELSNTKTQIFAQVSASF